MSTYVDKTQQQQQQSTSKTTGNGIQQTTHGNAVKLPGYTNNPLQPKGHTNNPLQLKGYTNNPLAPRGYVGNPLAPRGYQGNPLQMKSTPGNPFQMYGQQDAVQRQADPDEDDLIQGKFAPVQKVELEDEELPMQQKSVVQRQGEADGQTPELEEELAVQGKFEPAAPMQQQQAPVQKKPNDTGLPDNLKEGVENLSGYSMDDVKVHYNSDKPAQLQALAYAQGTDIHVGPGQEKHLPHEAWHVVQQKQGRVRPTLQMKGGVAVNDDKGLEGEADLMGVKAFRANEYEPNSGNMNDLLSQKSLYMVQPSNRTIPAQKISTISNFASEKALSQTVIQRKPVEEKGRIIDSESEVELLKVMEKVVYEEDYEEEWQGKYEVCEGPHKGKHVYYDSEGQYYYTVNKDGTPESIIHYLEGKSKAIGNEFNKKAEISQTHDDIINVTTNQGVGVIAGQKEIKIQTRDLVGCAIVILEQRSLFHGPCERQIQCI